MKTTPENVEKGYPGIPFIDEDKNGTQHRASDLALRKSGLLGNSVAGETTSSNKHPLGNGKPGIPETHNTHGGKPDLLHHNGHNGHNGYSSELNHINVHSTQLLGHNTSPHGHSSPHGHNVLSHGHSVPPQGHHMPSHGHSVPQHGHHRPSHGHNDQILAPAMSKPTHRGGALPPVASSSSPPEITSPEKSSPEKTRKKKKKMLGKRSPEVSPEKSVEKRWAENSPD